MITDDVLDLSKLEAGMILLPRKLFQGKVELCNKPFLPKTLCHSVVTMFHSQTEGRNLEIKLSFPEEIALSGDPGRISQILINLVFNALKFTEEGFVSISVSYDAITDTTVSVRFEVADSGVGMTLEVQAKIFNRFTSQQDGVKCVWWLWLR